MIYALCLVLISLGIYGMAVKKNVIKIVISFLILEYGLHLLLLLVGYRQDGSAPVQKAGQTAGQLASASVDPLPQALALISIGIGLGVLALMVAICIRLYERYGTFDITEMKRLKG